MQNAPYLELWYYYFVSKFIMSLFSTFFQWLCSLSQLNSDEIFSDIHFGIRIKLQMIATFSHSSEVYTADNSYNHHLSGLVVECLPLVGDVFGSILGWVIDGLIDWLIGV